MRGLPAALHRITFVSDQPWFTTRIDTDKSAYRKRSIADVNSVYRE